MTEQQGRSSAQTAEDLRGQVALVTGASSGIGTAVAEALARRGMRVALAARRAERLQELAERLASMPGGETLTLQCDVRDPDAVQRMVRA
ncbi:MAG TPA: SDR family NAD(P)-dependent oxidoreductase, partial [Ktedonobacterales bacterium]|nr:SDR family NAD(P)-dependent oxidoreductase [Ktedonobacterales bacterium]